MLILTRPKSGRIVTGVALGISELYGVPVTILRVAWVAAMIASPVAVLIYLLFSISIPDEAGVAGILSVEGLDSNMQQRERFTRFSQVLVQRLISPRHDYAISTNFVAVCLLILGAVLELIKVEGARFYYGHPIITSVSSDLARIGTAVFYIAIAVIFLSKYSRKAIRVSLVMPESEKFSLDSSSKKTIGGIAVGLSRVIRIDPSYIRVLLLLLNILTFGVVGVLYFLILFFFRRKNHGDVPTVVARFPRPFDSQEGAETAPLQEKNGAFYHILLALLFLALAAVRISSEFRLFFFNEPFIQGLIIAFAGIVIAWQSAISTSSRNSNAELSISLLTGSSMFFAGIYFLAITIGQVGITVGENIEIAEIVAALSLLYFGIVNLNGGARRLALLLSLIVGLCAASIGLHFAPVRDLAAVGQFYDFFYPVIFGVLALWIAFEK